jgi:Mlc titration factor MtfA (ptsG expression regulator)
MNDSITEIKKGESDINIYGATSKTEFFAIAAEYFFERPISSSKNILCSLSYLSKRFIKYLQLLEQSENFLCL